MRSRRIYINGSTSGYRVTYGRISRTPRTPKNSISLTFSVFIDRRGNIYGPSDSRPATTTISHGALQTTGKRFLF